MLSKKERAELEIMMADKKSAAELADAMDNNTSVSKRTANALRDALGSEKLAQEVLAKIAAPAPLSQQADDVLEIASASQEEAEALENDIEN